MPPTANYSITSTPIKYHSKRWTSKPSTTTNSSTILNCFSNPSSKWASTRTLKSKSWSGASIKTIYNCCSGSRRYSRAVGTGVVWGKTLLSCSAEEKGSRNCRGAVRKAFSISIVYFPFIWAIESMIYNTSDKIAISPSTLPIRHRTPPQTSSGEIP